jgi:hypothetical protein
MLPAPTSDVFVIPLSVAEIFYVSESHQIVSRIRVASPSAAEERRVQNPPASAAVDPSSQRKVSP